MSYYYFDFWYIEENKKFFQLINGNKIFDCFRGIKKIIRNNENLPNAAIVKKFSNDK